MKRPSHFALAAAAAAVVSAEALERPKVSRGEHRLNYGRLWPDTLYKADCSCGWSFGAATRETVIAAVREHEDDNL